MEDTEQNFDRIVRENYEQIFRTIMSIVMNKDDAQDLTQETFLRAYIKRHTFRGESEIATWLTRIAINVTINFLRRRDKLTEHQKQVEVPAPTEDHFDEKLSVWQALEKLSPDERLVLVMYYFHGFSQAEIAQRLGISLGAVKMRIKRAKAKFARYYGEQL